MILSFIFSSPYGLDEMAQFEEPHSVSPENLFSILFRKAQILHGTNELFRPSDMVCVCDPSFYATPFLYNRPSVSQFLLQFMRFNLSYKNPIFD